MNRLLICFAFVAMALPTSLLGQEYGSLLGIWEMTMETPRGPVTQVFSFTDADGDLSGTVSSRMGESNMENVSFEEGKVTFQVVRNFRGNSMTQTFTASVEGNELVGTLSGRRGGERPFRAIRRDG